MKQIISIHDVEGTLRHFESLRAEMRLKVAANGGVTYVSKRHGINQPSLSRVINSDKYVPKRYQTIIKYAQALKIETFEVEVPQTNTQSTLISIMARVDKLDSIIRQMVRYENLNKEDMPIVCEALINELQATCRVLKTMEAQNDTNPSRF